MCYDEAMEIGVLFDEGLEDCLDAGWIQSIAEQALIAQGIGDDVEMGLVVASQKRVQELNKTYRGKDGPTDVLAFSAREGAGADLPPFVQPPDGVLHLGEVIICYPYAVKQAEEHMHSIEMEIAILIIHGVLHLLGYEHDEPELARQMAAREAAILEIVKGDLA
jgi:probable rRNA maturation factor